MRIAFRADASQEIGTGHLARCLALADTLQSYGAQSVFVCRSVPASIREQIERHGHELRLLPQATVVPCPPGSGGYQGWLGVPFDVDASESRSVLGATVFDWLVVDHYALDHRWETLMRSSAARVAVIDDLANRNHNCEILLDQNFNTRAAQRYLEKTPTSCEVLTGPRHALLREEFRRARNRCAPRAGDVERILVFFGGADSGNHTSTAIRALEIADQKSCHVDVVIGAEHRCRSDIVAACGDLGFNVHVQTDRMAELMAVADLAIGAGGTATAERCCVGLPSLVLPVAENQREQVDEAALAGLVFSPKIGLKDASGIARHLRTLIENPLLRRSISVRGMEAVDGLGAIRMSRAMGVVITRIRAASPEDSESIFQWRNDPSVRNVSISPDPIDRTTHERWYAAALQNPNRCILIGESAGTPVGVVRFDISDQSAVVSIYKTPGTQTIGVGADLLKAAELWLRAHRPEVGSITAEVIGGNNSSQNLFANAGYAIDAMRYKKRLHS